jgi:hypothetical protein
MTCPNCQLEVPKAPFCVACGEPLDNAGSPYPHEHRGYAAAPHERWFAPHIVSTLFPHLPRAHMWPFRIALGAGAAAIVALCAAGLFPLALVVAAILVPFVSALYLWDVDLYEDEPLAVLAGTAAWGVAVGVGLGFAARHLAGPPQLLGSGPATHDVIWLGVVLPAVGAVLALAGPLALLPYRRFNDVLDGATFGGIAAVFMLGAEVVTNSSSFLGGGLSAPGDASLWVPRLFMLAVAVPVAGAGFAGAAAGAFWLRFRASKADRQRLGLLGTPVVAVALAVAALIAVEIVVFYLGPWAELAVAAAVAAAGLVLLRRTLHLGLQQEAAEIEIGEPIRCPNCARQMPLHTFCAECGVSLQAVPKSGARSGAGSSLADSRLRHGAAVAALGAAGVAVTGIAVLVIVLVRPGPVQPVCQPGRPCATPLQAQTQTAASASATSGAYVYWTSSLGPNVRYWNQDWKIMRSTGTYVLAQSRLTRSLVRTLVLVSPGTVTADQSLQAQLAAEKKTYLGLARDAKTADQVLGPEIGFTPATAETYTATLNEPPSPSRRVELVFEVAANGKATVLTEAVTSTADQSQGSSPFPSLYAVDKLMDNFGWGP